MCYRGLIGQVVLLESEVFERIDRFTYIGSLSLDGLMFDEISARI